MTYKTGTPVIYCKSKYGTDPGPRAVHVSPARYGDLYSYCVEKLWLVVACPSSDKIEVMTRRGKRMELDVNDPNLRPANLLDRLRHWGRFPKPETE